MGYGDSVVNAYPKSKKLTKITSDLLEVEGKPFECWAYPITLADDAQSKEILKEYPADPNTVAMMIVCCLNGS